VIKLALTSSFGANCQAKRREFTDLGNLPIEGQTLDQFIIHEEEKVEILGFIINGHINYGV
jgi:hypothetical protein